MDYRINPIVTQLPVNRNKASQLSFKRSYEAAVITPTNAVFIQNSNDNTDGTSNPIKALTKSIDRARKNLVEVMPLLDPVNSYKAIREETRSSKADKKSKNKQINYEA